MIKDPLKSKYLAFILSEASRAELLKTFPPAHERIIAHHITIQFNVNEAGLKMMNEPTPVFKVMAYGKDSKIDCVLVSDGSSCMRRDGSFYHVTLSCSPTGKPVDSNAFLKLNYHDGNLEWSGEPLTLTGNLGLVNK